MPWTATSITLQREKFVGEARQQTGTFLDLCRRYAISRKTGYKWLRRAQQEGRTGLCDQSRRPQQPAAAQAQRWRAEAVRLRRKHRSWGAKKICALLAAQFGAKGLPDVRTVERWWKEKGLLRPWYPARRGPAVPHPGLTKPQRAHEVWTVDYKGWYRTGDGQRQEPLTVRDLHTRFLLVIRLLPNQSDDKAWPVFLRLFAQHGLPEAIRVDNGAPFGGKGALGLTRLSVRWLRLGIRVEFTRPATPGDNAGHEQMHKLFAAEIAHHASANRAAEQRRVERWRRQYNEQRPHEALGQRPPSAGYRPSPRRCPAKVSALRYAAEWGVRRVRTHGDIKWEGRLRFIGRAFVGQSVGLKPLNTGTWEVYLGQLLLGELHATDPASMRPAHWDRLPGARTKPAPNHP